MNRKKPNFFRRSVYRYSKLGLRKKKKQKWKRPTGRDNKMREKRRGYPATVSIGYRTDKKIRGKIENKKTIIIRNLNDLFKIKDNEMVIIGRIGKKKMIEIAKEAKEKKIKIYNLNTEKLLKNLEKEEKTDKKISAEEAKKIIEEKKKMEETSAKWI